MNTVEDIKVGQIYESISGNNEECEVVKIEKKDSGLITLGLKPIKGFNWAVYDDGLVHFPFYSFLNYYRLKN